MSLVQDWVPPTRENYEKILLIWQIAYPIIGACQFVSSWYGMGKTSVESRLNVPGRIGWFLMEIPGFTLLLYIMNTLPRQVGIFDLPWQNKVLAGLFVIHYMYRAVIFPFIQPSMSPIHLGVMSMATGFQICNATCLGSYLAAYGPTSQAEWADALYPFGIAQFAVGIVIFYMGLTGNYFHDEELREIRRTEQRRQERVRNQQKKNAGPGDKISVDKHYRVPETMLFKYMLFPHYFCEWVEWFGFWMATGWSAPARAFLVNEMSAMVPRAANGRKWYAEKFGEEKVRKKWAAIPGIF